MSKIGSLFANDVTRQIEEVIKVDQDDEAVIVGEIDEYVVTDSKVERSFVEKLDVSDEVVVYSKLPRGFFIPTPVGDYNPDWAIAFRDDTTKIKHVYFVAETKGSMSSMQLKGIEEAKSECARKFFASLSSKAEQGEVKYDVVDSYDSLLSLVGA